MATGDIKTHYFGTAPAEGERDERHILTLSSCDSYAGLCGLTFWSVSFGEFSSYNPYADEGEEDQGCYNMWHSELYLSLEEAEAAFERRKLAENPLVSQNTDNMLYELVKQGLPKVCNHAADHIFTIMHGTLEDEVSPRARRILKNFVSHDDTNGYYDGNAVYLAMQKGGAASVQLPAWKLLEIAVATTAIAVAYLQGSPDWDGSWSEAFERTKLELGEDAAAALQGLTSTSAKATGGASEKVVACRADALWSVLHMGAAYGQLFDADKARPLAA